MARITLTTPKQVTYWRLVELQLRINTIEPSGDPEMPAGSNAQVLFIMENDQGEQWRYSVRGDDADFILSYVNKADFSGTNPSFYQQALQWLVDNNVVDGTIE